MTLETSGPGHVVPDEVADQLGQHLVRLIRLIDRSRAQHASTRGEYGVEHAAYVLLFHLVSEGPRRAGELAESVHSDPSTVSRQVANLVQLGLVERQSDPRDGRACLLAATDEGVRLFERARTTRSAHIAGLLTDWSVADREQLAALLGRFAGALEKDSEVSPAQRFRRPATTADHEEEE
jgi:DNA-binding MarR family transcriptional regulator